MEEEGYFISNLLAFFDASDGIEMKILLRSSGKLFQYTEIQTCFLITLKTESLRIVVRAIKGTLHEILSGTYVT